MKTNKKILIGVAVGAALLILIVLGAIVAGGAYIYHLAGDPELTAKLHKAKADGTAFGATTDQTGCMEKGFTLRVPVDAFDISGENFVNACLHASRPSPDFCAGVPFVFDREWFADECDKAGHHDAACTNAFIAKRNFCRMDSKDKP